MLYDNGNACFIMFCYYQSGTKKWYRYSSYCFECSNQSLVTMKVTKIGTNLALVLRLVLTILLVFARLDLTPDFWYPECQ